MLSCSLSLLELAHRQPAGSANSHSRRQTRKPVAFRAGRTPVKAGLYSGCSDPRSKLAQGTTNHLYSVSAVTNQSGQVVERYSYNAYGVRTVKNPANVVIAKSVVNSDRGFTSYKLDAETALYAARARMYSGRLGRFVSRDPFRIYMKIKRAESNIIIQRRPSISISLGGLDLDVPAEYEILSQSDIAHPRSGDGYLDGMSLYGAFFSPLKTDPSGMCTLELCQRPVDVPGGIGHVGAVVIPLAQHWFLKATFMKGDLDKCCPSLSKIDEPIVKETGLGALGGGANPDPGQIGSQTQPVDHAGQSGLPGVKCTQIPGDFDCCKLWSAMTTYTPTGMSCGLDYNCHHWVSDVVDSTRIPGPIPPVSPFDPPMFDPPIGSTPVFLP